MQCEKRRRTGNCARELILSDNNRLVILDYGGGTDTSSVEEAVQGFLEPLLKQ